MEGYLDAIYKKVRKILFGTSDELLWDSRFELDEVFFKLRDIVKDYISMNNDSLIQKYNTKIHKE